MEFCDLIEKYNITFIDGQRYYQLTFDAENIYLENTSPICLKINEKEFKVSSWKQALLEVFFYLDSLTIKTDVELLSTKNWWGRQEVFSRLQDSNYEKVRQNLYLNCNYTSIHLFHSIQLLLDIYNIDKSTCNLIIRRHPISEPKEVQNYFHNKIKNAFKFYLKDILNKSDDKVETISNNIEIINKRILPLLHTGYNDLYNIDNRNMFYNIQKKLKTKLSHMYNIAEKTKKVIAINLNYLNDFYKLYEPIKIEEINDYYNNKTFNEEDELDSYFNSLDVNELIDLLETE